MLTRHFLATVSAMTLGVYQEPPPTVPDASVTAFKLYTVVKQTPAFGRVTAVKFYSIVKQTPAYGRVTAMKTYVIVKGA